MLTFNFLFPSEVAGRKLEEVLILEEFIVDMECYPGQSARGMVDPWLVEATHESIVNAEVIAAGRQRFTQLAETYGDFFDGWEAEAKP